MAGIDFFPTSKETKIKVTNLRDVSLLTELLSDLLSETLLATPIAQFYFERVFEEKSPVGEPIDGIYHYRFSVEQVIQVLQKSGKSTDSWEKYDPRTEVILIATACEPEVPVL